MTRSVPQKDVEKLLKSSRALAKKYNFDEKEIPKVIAEVRKSKTD